MLGAFLLAPGAAAEDEPRGYWELYPSGQGDLLPNAPVEAGSETYNFPLGPAQAPAEGPLFQTHPLHIDLIVGPGTLWLASVDLSGSGIITLRMEVTIDGVVVDEHERSGIVLPGPDGYILGHDQWPARIPAGSRLGYRWVIEAETPARVTTEWGNGAVAFTYRGDGIDLAELELMNRGEPRNPDKPEGERNDIVIATTTTYALDGWLQEPLLLWGLDGESERLFQPNATEELGEGRIRTLYRIEEWGNGTCGTFSLQWADWGGHEYQAPWTVEFLFSEKDGELLSAPIILALLVLMMFFAVGVAVLVYRNYRAAGGRFR